MSWQPVSSNQDFSSSVEAILVDKCLIRVDDLKSQDQLRSKGFGETEDSRYYLKSYEALYLLYINKLNVNQKKRTINFGELTKIALKYDKDTITRFLIYRDLRSKGYVVKEGFGFGADFRVYERGEYERKGTKYVIFGVNEGTNTNVNSLFRSIKQIETMGKESIIAVVERRGEVIYYKLSRIKFAYNKNITSQENGRHWL